MTLLQPRLSRPTPKVLMLRPRRSNYKAFSVLLISLDITPGQTSGCVRLSIPGLEWLSRPSSLREQSVSEPNRDFAAKGLSLKAFLSHPLSLALPVGSFFAASDCFSLQAQSLPLRRRFLCYPNFLCYRSQTAGYFDITQGSNRSYARMSEVRT